MKVLLQKKKIKLCHQNNNYVKENASCKEIEELFQYPNCHFVLNFDINQVHKKLRGTVLIIVPQKQLN